MIHAMKLTRNWYSVKWGVPAVAAVALLSGGMTEFAPTTAGASGTVNTFTFKGAYSGTLKLSPSSFNCSYGKTYSGKGYLVTLSHMRGTIKGAGSGPWAMTIIFPKQGTTHVDKADVKSYSDGSFQSSGSRIVAFLEMSGTVTYNGSKGSLHLTVEHHVVGSTVYQGVATVTGSWSC
ncbi:MAG TPA: hypothetical protein VIJ86_02740 [Acidimicrobiales bacterium]